MEETDAERQQRQTRENFIAEVKKKIDNHNQKTEDKTTTYVKILGLLVDPINQAGLHSQEITDKLELYRTSPPILQGLRELYEIYGVLSKNDKRWVINKFGAQFYYQINELLMGFGGSTAKKVENIAAIRTFSNMPINLNGIVEAGSVWLSEPTNQKDINKIILQAQKTGEEVTLHIRFKPTGGQVSI